MMTRNRKRMKLDSSGQETTHTTDPIPTHPAVLSVFRTENILEEICSYLEFTDLKQFRLVSRTCNYEARRALMKRDVHWVVVESRYDGWHLGLDKVLTKLEKTASAGGQNCNKRLLGWTFRRLELNYWEHSLRHPFSFLEQWGHYLRKIHLKAGNYNYEKLHTFSISHVINTMHNLLSVCCPNLDEMVVELENLKYKGSSSLFINVLDMLDFPTPLLNLKCLRVTNITSLSAEEREVLQRFFTRLVRAAGTALEILEIHYEFISVEMERKMLVPLALNVGDSNFQSLKEITLQSADNVTNLSHAVQKCLPGLSKLILRWFTSASIAAIRPESFPALKSLTIHYIGYRSITNGRILFFLQHFPNLEVLTVSSGRTVVDGWTVIPNPIAPVSKSLRSFTFGTEDYDLRLLRCAVNMFPNLVTLNLLGFGLGRVTMYRKCEPEYTFGELIDTISPLNRLQHLYVNHAFHTSLQLVDAIHLTSNLTALQTIVLSQTAHNQDFNVSLYLTTSDPEFQYILNCDGVKILKSIQLLGFRFGSTQKEVVEEAAAKGGLVSFGTICPCYVMPLICENQSRLETCPGWKPICHS